MVDMQHKRWRHKECNGGENFSTASKIVFVNNRMTSSQIYIRTHVGWRLWGLWCRRGWRRMGEMIINGMFTRQIWQGTVLYVTANTHCIIRHNNIRLTQTRVHRHQTHRHQIHRQHPTRVQLPLWHPYCICWWGQEWMLFPRYLLGTISQITLCDGMQMMMILCKISDRYIK